MHLGLYCCCWRGLQIHHLGCKYFKSSQPETQHDIQRTWSFTAVADEDSWFTTVAAGIISQLSQRPKITYNALGASLLLQMGPLEEPMPPVGLGLAPIVKLKC